MTDAELVLDRLLTVAGGLPEGWRVPESRAAEARALVGGAPSGYVAASTSAPARPYRPMCCKVCGARAERNSRGYSVTKILRSGECVDCYEERKMGY